MSQKETNKTNVATEVNETAQATGAVDFNNPEALEAELAAAQANKSVDTTAKAPKEKKPKVIKVSFTADKDIAAGETVTFDYTLPASVSRGRGVNYGIALEEMTEEQLKIEYRNANSVLYKTKKAGRDATKAQERLDKVVEAMNAKGIKPGQRAAAPTKVDASAVAKLIASGELSIDDINKMLESN